MLYKLRQAEAISANLKMLIIQAIACELGRFVTVCVCVVCVCVCVVCVVCVCACVCVCVRACVHVCVIDDAKQ